jgi:hypothetical protein
MHATWLIGGRQCWISPVWHGTKGVGLTAVPEERKRETLKMIDL